MTLAQVKVVSSLAQDFVPDTIDSEAYRSKMSFAMSRAWLSFQDRKVVIALATALNTRHRILYELEMKYQGPELLHQQCLPVPQGGDRAQLPGMFHPSERPLLRSQGLASKHRASELKVEDFLRNPWAGQIYLDHALLEKRKVREARFWPKGFDGHRRDRYLLTEPDGKVFGNGQNPYSRADVQQLFLTKVKSLPGMQQQQQLIAHSS